MKIDVTYEKEDILRLVKDDLERRNIRLKNGTMPEYKGALMVKLSIDAEEENGAPLRAQAAVVPPSQGTQSTDGDATTPVADPDETEDMTTVLSQSRRVAATTKPTFKTPKDDELKRSLGRDESLEFPREG